jgi:hypothetical protein
MTLAVSSTIAVLAIIGLVIGLVVLIVVIFLLNGVYSPIRKILSDVKVANTAPMLTRGVPGTDQLGQTRQLAESVPPLALAYLAKLGASPAPAPAPVAAAPPPPPSQAPDAPYRPPERTYPAPAQPPASSPAQTGFVPRTDQPAPPAEPKPWSNY